MTSNEFFREFSLCNSEVYICFIDHVIEFATKDQLFCLIYSQLVTFRNVK